MVFILLAPFCYEIIGGYKNYPWLRFNLQCSPAFIFSGKWNEQESKCLQARIIILGIPFNINVEKFKAKEKAEEKKRVRKKKGFSSILIVLDKDLRGRGIALIKDLLKILKPDQLLIKGKFGFDEPHLTGWLAAFTHSLHYCCNKTFIELEPVWENECYELETSVSGRIRVGTILVKIGWFLLKNRLKQLFHGYFNKKAAVSTRLLQ